MTAIVSGRFTAMDKWELAERVLSEAEDRGAEVTRAVARGRWKRAFVFERTKATERRKQDAAARAPKGMITALLGPLERDNDLGAAEVKSCIALTAWRLSKLTKARGGC